MHGTSMSGTKKWLALLLATAGLFLGALPALRARSDSPAPGGPVRLQLDPEPLDRERQPAISLSPIVRKVSPSVVQVFTSARMVRGPGPNMEDPIFRWFFGNPEPQDPRAPRRAPRMPRQEGIGSGVVVTEDGYILTNNHVIDGADEVRVALNDGREFPAKVVGRDPKTDVAVLKVEADGLVPVAISDSDQLEVGDLVLAVGNPFGVGQTVTMGIVSAKGRGVGILGDGYEDFIQTDASINPGNSGGALVDARGRLVGINTAILSRSGGNQGIGFAIPANLARDVMEALVRDGRVTRGFLGILIQDVTPPLARQFELPPNSGALVAEVNPKGPADRAGLKSGDVILEFNGREIRDSRSLRLEVARTRPGSTVPVKVQRDGKPREIRVKVDELEGGPQVAGGPGGSADDEGTLNGVGVTDLTREVRRQSEIPDRIRGVLVTEVDPDSAAHEAGLREGDILLEINRQPVETADEAVRLTERPEDMTTLLKIWSRGNTRFLVVDETESR